MRPLVLLCSCLVLPGYGDLVGPKEISGFEGDTVSLYCTYGYELQPYFKYWCREKGLIISRCSDIIYAEEDGQETTRGRVSIQNDPYQRKFKVTLRKLTLQDAGGYMCGVSRLGLDTIFRVSLKVFPGPCCSRSPIPSFQPPTTRSLQPKAKAWQTQPPELTPPRLHRTVTTAKRGTTGAKAFPFTRPPLRDHRGTSRYTGTSPYAGTAPHTGTSPPAGTSHLFTQLDSTSAEDTSLVPRSSSSKSRVAIPMVRILAPVLVLLTLLLAAGLAAFGRSLLRWRKEAQLANGTQENEKVHPSHLELGNSWVSEYAVINFSGPTEPGTSPKLSPCPNTEILRLNQASKEDEDSLPDPEGDMIQEPPLHLSREQLGFVPV
ncbi:CMRF35-like molecule 9 isoform X2 [Talpa occidentalis]|uniref:CMRF35-like molecule 9 isoform X2 n=1 Tax=Talpa occidentalis TaxID=50954 RepID=UPI00188DFD59|nr:CMRF35-like molecule 9 isoform X2 [Talpa occidentalis]